MVVFGVITVCSFVHNHQNDLGSYTIVGAWVASAPKMHHFHKYNVQVYTNEQSWNNVKWEFAARTTLNLWENYELVLKHLAVMSLNCTLVVLIMGCFSLIENPIGSKTYMQ